MNTLIKRKRFFPSHLFFDDFLTRNFFEDSNWTGQNNTLPAVNIVESNDEFRVEMAAPGMKKENFHAELDNEMLTIWSEFSDNEDDNDHHYTRKEFSYQSFKRSFYLPNTVDSDRIEAKYQDGLLSLVIPKKEEAKRKPVKTIAIS